MASPSISRIGRAALDLLYPPRCAVCRRDGTFLCEDCAASLPRAAGERCEVCWLPLASAGCRGCRQLQPRFSRLRAVLRYEGAVPHIVHALKFGGQSSLAPSLGSLLEESRTAFELEADIVVPVPLTRQRRRIRGYNQAALMAAEMGRLAGLPYADAMRRDGHSMPQARSETSEVRRANVAGVFSVAKPQAVAGQSVLLVDDVATTGATLSACAVALLEAGAVSVSALTLARED